MSMNILLISGHTSGHNKMKNGSRNEGDLNIEVVKLLKPRLEELEDVKVYVYPTACDAFVDIQKGVFTKRLPIPASKIDYVLECHFNALNGNYNKDGKVKGSEIFVTSREKGISVEQAIMRNMKKYFPLRDNDGKFDGVKVTNFLVINTLKSMGVSASLLEMCFYDDEDDMKIYYDHKGEIMDGIVAGIAEGFGLKKRDQKDPDPKPAPKPTPKPTPKPSIYYKKYTGKSGRVDEVLAAIDVPSAYRGSWMKRRTIAKKNGISNYEGTAAQNRKLISLAKAGKLKTI